MRLLIAIGILALGFALGYGAAESELKKCHADHQETLEHIGSFTPHGEHEEH